MRRLLLIVSLWLLLLPQRAAAQGGQEPTAPFEGADQLLVFTADTGQVALTRMIRALRQTGFELDTAIAGFAQTLFVPIAPAYEPGVPATVAARVRVRPSAGGSVLLLDGTCLADSRLRADRMVKSDDLCYCGRRRSVPRAAFRMLQSAALAYPGGRVAYQRWADTSR